MSRACQDCGRPSGDLRETCVYCGHDLPPIDAAVEAPSPRSLPPDLDQLVRRAMAQGSVASLEAALRDHQDAGGSPPAAELPSEAAPDPVSVPAKPQPAPAPLGPPISIADTLADLGDALDDARLAWVRGDVVAVRSWTEQAGPKLKRILTQLDREEAEEDAQIPLLPDAPTDPGVPDLPEGFASQVPSPPQPPAEQPPLVSPTIVLPKVRHPLSLVVEGMGDAERGPALAEALGVDGVTARLVAVSCYPRLVLRGEDRVRLEQTAERVRESLGIRTTVVDREGLLEIGPAVSVTRALTRDPLTVEVVDRAMWDVDLTAQPGSEPRELTPEILLGVVGAIVVQLYRSPVQGGRLKHLRETRVQGAGEDRLGVVDLHTADGILRVVEGATELSGFPGHTPSASGRSLRDFVAHLETQVRVMPRRICQPGLDRPGGGVVAGQSGVSMDTGWAAFEEHSRACRLLYG